MTPASSIMHFLAPNGPKHGMVMKQCEDEIRFDDMAVGAGQMGIRAMTATSGWRLRFDDRGRGPGRVCWRPRCHPVNVPTRRPFDRPSHEDRAKAIFSQVLGAGRRGVPPLILAPQTIEAALPHDGRVFQKFGERYQCRSIIISDLMLFRAYERWTREL